MISVTVPFVASVLTLFICYNIVVNTVLIRERRLKLVEEGQGDFAYFGHYPLLRQFLDDLEVLTRGDVMPARHRVGKRRMVARLSSAAWRAGTPALQTALGAGALPRGGRLPCLS